MTDQLPFELDENLEPFAIPITTEREEIQDGKLISIIETKTEIPLVKLESKLARLQAKRTEALFSYDQEIAKLIQQIDLIKAA